jgi:predicted DNA-binding protein
MNLLETRKTGSIAIPPEFYNKLYLILHELGKTSSTLICQIITSLSLSLLSMINRALQQIELRSRMISSF